LHSGHDLDTDKHTDNDTDTDPVQNIRQGRLAIWNVLSPDVPEGYHDLLEERQAFVDMPRFFEHGTGNLRLLHSLRSLVHH
jgi:hypothetical protein